MQYTYSFQYPTEKGSVLVVIRHGGPWVEVVYQENGVKFIWGERWLIPYYTNHDVSEKFAANKPEQALRLIRRYFEDIQRKDRIAEVDKVMTDLNNRTKVLTPC